MLHQSFNIATLAGDVRSPAAKFTVVRKAFFPKGNYVYADYCTGEIFMWDGTTQTMLLDTARLIVAFGADESGELYVVGQNGTVEKIVGTAVRPEENLEKSRESRIKP